jgi:hypothetical protein
LWLELAELYEQEGLADAAGFSYRRVIEAFAGDEPQHKSTRRVALLKLARLYISLERWSDAHSALSQVTKLHPVRPAPAQPCSSVHQLTAAAHAHTTAHAHAHAQDNPVALFMQGLVSAHNKEYNKARALLLNAQRREERKTGAPLPLTHLHLSQLCEQITNKDLPAALAHAQLELALLQGASSASASSSAVAVPPSVFDLVQARIDKLAPARE